MNIPSVPVPDHPYMADKAIAEMQQQLKDKLCWLNYSFGICQKLVKEKNEREFYYPAVYVGQREYLDVFPQDDLGNFCFFQIDDRTDITWRHLRGTQLKVPISIIFWFDLSRIYPREDYRHTERIKGEILNALTSIILSNGSVSFSRIHEKAEDVYSEYSIREVDTQFFMQPYGGMRFEGELIYNLDCSGYNPICP